MSSISAVSAPQTPVPAAIRAADADGDNDGTQAKVARLAPTPVQAVPAATATKGNSVNNYA